LEDRDRRLDADWLVAQGAEDDDLAAVSHQASKLRGAVPAHGVEPGADRSITDKSASARFPAGLLG
jgi:hypothetical protein